MLHDFDGYRRILDSQPAQRPIASERQNRLLPEQSGNFQGAAVTSPPSSQPHELLSDVRNARISKFNRPSRRSQDNRLITTGGNSSLTPTSIQKPSPIGANVKESPNITEFSSNLSTLEKNRTDEIDLALARLHQINESLNSDLSTFENRLSASRGGNLYQPHFNTLKNTVQGYQRRAKNFLEHASLLQEKNRKEGLQEPSVNQLIDVLLRHSEKALKGIELCNQTLQHAFSDKFNRLLPMLESKAFQATTNFSRFSEELPPNLTPALNYALKGLLFRQEVEKLSSSPGSEEKDRYVKYADYCFKNLNNILQQETPKESPNIIEVAALGLEAKYFDFSSLSQNFSEASNDPLQNAKFRIKELLPRECARSLELERILHNKKAFIATENDSCQSMLENAQRFYQASYDESENILSLRKKELKTLQTLTQRLQQSQERINDKVIENTLLVVDQDAAQQDNLYTNQKADLYKKIGSLYQALAEEQKNLPSVKGTADTVAQEKIKALSFSLREVSGTFYTEAEIKEALEKIASLEDEFGKWIAAKPDTFDFQQQLESVTQILSSEEKKLDLLSKDSPAFTSGTLITQKIKTQLERASELFNSGNFSAAFDIITNLQGKGRELNKLAERTKNVTPVTK